MKGNSFFTPATSKPKLLVSISLVFVCAALAAAQTAAPSPTQTPALVAPAVEVTPTPAPTPSETVEARRRISRARALAAIGKLAAAASELESLRSSTADESVRDVSRVLLVSIFVEMPDYARASALLEEAFKARSSSGPGGAAAQAYFALAGQTVSAVRTHLERYRTFGLDVTDVDLPVEAFGDLDQLRGLLEVVVEQAKAIGAEQARSKGARPGAEATALLEDAATARMRIARAGEDRTRWQRQVAEARQQLFASETRIASVSALPAARSAEPAPTSQPAPAPGNSRPAPVPSSASSSAAPQPQQNRPQQSAATNTGAARPEGSAPVAVGSLITKARKRTSPVYPPGAKQMRITGVVSVFLVVNAEGDVVSVERTEGPEPLRQAAVDAAKRWKFLPTVVNGQPVPFTGYLTFDFRP